MTATAGSVAYPFGLLLNYTYTSLGYASQIVGPGGLAYWTANTRDAELRLTQETAGNGIVTAQSFDAQTGRLMDILAGTGNIVRPGIGARRPCRDGKKPMFFTVVFR